MTRRLPAAIANPCLVTVATGYGLVAVLLWSSLAGLTQLSKPIPAFELSAISFAVTFLAGLVHSWYRGERLRQLIGLPVRRWAWGIVGIPGNLMLYFAALRCTSASPAGVNLVNYLWPLLIVVLSAVVLKERMQPRQYIGMAVGFAGAVLVILGDHHLGLETRDWIAYLLALGSAVCWAGYSVASRRQQDRSASHTSLFCGAAVLPTWICHRLTEVTVWPTTWQQWIALLAIGIGPLGLAFITWDYGNRHGNARVLTAASFMIPVLSTTVLVVMGQVPFGSNTLIACGLVMAGVMLVASRRQPTASIASRIDSLARAATKTDRNLVASTSDEIAG